MSDTPKAIDATDENEPYSFYSGWCNLLFTDGHVAFVRDSIGLATFAVLGTRAGCAVVGGQDYRSAEAGFASAGRIDYFSSHRADARRSPSGGRT